MRRLTLLSFVLAAAVAAPAALASSIVSTSNTKFVSLKVNDQGQALVTYLQGGTKHTTLAYGAENAIAPKKGAKQVDFTYDYSGGYTLFKDEIAEATKQLRSYQSAFTEAQHAAKAKGKRYTPDVLKYSALVQKAYATIKGLHTKAKHVGDGFHCAKYKGPKLADLVGACTAPDGSFWAVQQWQRQLPDYGVAATARQSALELHLSHWTGPLAVLTVGTDWSYHKWEHLFGTFTYRGEPVFGFGSTSTGQPLDTFGRNVYLDSYGSDYDGGAGAWTRVNSFLTHRSTGAWCYGISPHPTPTSPTGAGTKYRLTVIGPGVTPDISVTVDSPGAYDAAVDQAQNAKIAALGDSLCKPN
jgi:hypothetical protein